MKQLVIMPGGFHPFHAGHKALYDAARRAFPTADVYVAATDDTSTRPFPFAVKEKLAKLAGVEPNHFVRVKSPFRVQEITQNYDPNDTVLIFVRSEKDKDKPPQAGGTKRDGTPAYLQTLSDDPRPMSQHGYMTYLPTVEFGPGLTSATEIRTAWPGLDDRRKTALVMSLYPRTQQNVKLAQNVVKLLDQAIVGSVEENQGWAATYNEQAGQMAGTPASGLMASYQRRENQPMAEADPDRKKKAAHTHRTTKDPELLKAMLRSKIHYAPYADDPETAYAKWIQRALSHSEENDRQHQQEISRLRREVQELRKQVERLQGESADADFLEEKWSEKYKRSIDCNNPRGFSQKAHCAGRKK